MVWIYNSPLSVKERKAYDVLKQKFGDAVVAKNTVKLITLVGLVKTTKFESPKEIETSFFFDEDRKDPIFNKSTSETLFKELKQRGGAASNYPFIDYSAKQSAEKLGSVLPEYISYPIQNFYNLLTTPLLTLKQTVPLADIAISAANGIAETGITVVGDLAKTIGGPMGSLISIPIVAFAAAMATTSSLAQRDLGQSVIYMISALPFIGAIAVKGMDKVEKQVSKIKKYPQIAYYVPFVSDYINEERKSKGLPPLESFDPAKAMRDKIQANPYAQKAIATANTLKAGKRFLTQKNKHSKWKRTRRNKSART